MGYGIILSSDDQALRDMLESDPIQAVDDLETALGGNSYPGTRVEDQKVGAWTRHASLHSGMGVAMDVNAHGMRILEMNETPEDLGTWASSLTGGEQNLAAQDWLRCPTPLPPGTDVLDAAFGRDQASSTVRSVWWVHADSLPWALEAADKQELAAQLAAMLKSRSEHTVRIGSYVNALNRAGGLVHGQASLWWSGNRVARSEQLTPNEQRALLV